MVAQAGASSEAPVSIRAVTPTLFGLPPVKLAFPVVAITRYRMEAAHGYHPTTQIRPIHLDYRRCSPRYADNYRKKFTISPQRLSRKPAALWRGITLFFAGRIRTGAYMLNYFRVAGCATARSGELVEFVYIVDARSAIGAKAEALNQARNERLSTSRLPAFVRVAA